MDVLGDGLPPGALAGAALSPLSDASLGALGALGSAGTWAVISLLARRLAPDLNSISINAARSTLGGGLLLGWVLLTGGGRDLGAISPRTFGLLAVSIVVAIGIGDTVFFESIRSLGLARAMTVSMTYPLLATLLAAATLGEAITPRVAAGSLLTLGGLVLIVAARGGGDAGGGRFWTGIGAASLASVAWALSVVVLKAPLAELDATTAQAVRLPVAGVLLWATPWTWGAVGRLRRGGPGVMWALVGLAGLTAVSSVMFVAGVKYAGVAVATVLSSTAPMFAIPLGALFLGERLAAATVLGTFVTMAGIAVLRL